MKKLCLAALWIVAPTSVLADEPETPSEDQGEVIMITGSAIERKELTTPAPVAVMSKQDLDAAGLVSVGDILQKMPGQAGAINTQFNNGGDGSTRISLRGLGEDRTLVLVNGRRHVPGGLGADSSVDLNAIPTVIIERIEVLKDGASAIYGSDALGGVVNIITRRDFDGVEANAYTGMAQHGKTLVYDVSAVAGTKSKRGGIVFAAGYSEQRPMFASERSFSKSDKFYDWECTPEAEQAGDCQRVTTNGSTAVPNGYLNVLGDPEPVGNAAWQELRNKNESGIYVNDPATGWREFDGSGNADVGEGDLYNYQSLNYLVTPLRRYNVYTAGNYELQKHVTSFFEASYTNRASDQTLAPSPLFIRDDDMVLAGNSVYNPFRRNFIDVRRRVNEAGNRNSVQRVDTFRGVVGIEGDLPEKLSDTWRWNLSFNHGRTQGTDKSSGQFIKSRLKQAIGPSYRDADSTPHCGTRDNPGDPACVPVNLLGGEGAITPDMLNYIAFTGVLTGFTEQTTLLATANGRIVKTPWNGDLRLALGAEYRGERGGYTPDPLTASGDTTGNAIQATDGGYNVKSAFAEVSFVPVSEKLFAKWLELSGAVRAFDYSSFGSDWTWKAGALWSLPAGLSVRGTYSTAFRAPNIGELFSGQSDGQPAVTDPCDTSMGERTPLAQMNCQAAGLPDDYVDDRTQIRTIGGGNQNLQPETARVKTVGLVFEPPRFKSLAFTIDYFHVRVKNAIQPLGASVILSNCFNQEVPSDCDKIERDSTGFIQNIRDTETNVGGTVTSGTDLSVQFDQSSKIGRFQSSVEATLLHRYDEIQPNRRVEGRGVYDLELVLPKWKANFAASWSKGPLSLGGNGRLIGHIRECEDNDCSGDNPSRTVAKNFTADAFTTVELKTPAGTSLLTAGVNNILDQDPAVIYNGFLGTSDALTYDFLGRFFYLRLTQQF